MVSYSAPHPSEAKIHIRIQTYGARSWSLCIPNSVTYSHDDITAPDGVSSLVVLHEALDNLEHMTLSIQSAYLASLSAQEYVVPPEVAYDFESVNNRLWEEREMRPGQEGSREVFETAQREKEETRMKEINSREQKVKVVIKPKK